MSVRVVAIDGPAGAGKSSASRALAARLGFTYVDTGSMYRAVGLLAKERGIALDDDPALARLIDALRIDSAGERLVIDGRDLSAAVRSAEAGELASRVSTRPVVRERLVALQRAIGRRGDVVMEGRDIGTVVFPDAGLKVFLTASPEERARRRARELAARGEPADERQLAADIARRDRRDSERAHSPLRPAADAVIVDTTGMDLATVVDRLTALAETRWPARRV
ncbi:MAG TPA: (d)CMP kinase [Candidatus Limnocylindria bacterium]|nr:(d)CMP kinase [Candidatus Limnocylindria bacterium]